MILQASQFLATLSTTLFCGAAIYINVAEHPSRTDLDNRSAAAQWAASYKRAIWMQAPLALLGFLAGTSAWIIGDGLLWLIAALYWSGSAAHANLRNAYEQASPIGRSWSHLT